MRFSVGFIVVSSAVDSVEAFGAGSGPGCVEMDLKSRLDGEGFPWRDLICYFSGVRIYLYRVSN